MFAKSHNVLMVLNTARSCGKDSFLFWSTDGTRGIVPISGQHAGENLSEVPLKQVGVLKPPIPMRGGMACNVPDLSEGCHYVLEAFGDVYPNGARSAPAGKDVS